MGWVSLLINWCRHPHVKVHDVFHVSLLNKYVPYPSHVLDFYAIQMKETREFIIEPLRIVGSKQQHLRKRVIIWVKVRWQHYSEDDDTWELESEMRRLYPHLFSDYVAPEDRSPCYRGEDCYTPCA